MGLRWSNLAEVLAILGLTLVGAATTEPVQAKEGKPPRIECDVSLPCSVEEVWAAWTTPEGLESFLARSAKISLKEGGDYDIDLGGGSPSELLHSRPPQILHVDAPRMLKFEWVVPLPEAAARDPMTVVTVRLEPASGRKCRVRLEHSGWTPGEESTEAFAYSQRSWKMVLRNLRTWARRTCGK